MLVNKQITMPSTAFENKQLEKELADLKAYIQMKNKEFNALKILVDKTAKSNDALEKKLQAAAISLRVTQRDLDKQFERVNRLNEVLDNLQQYRHKNSLEFHRIPENPNQSTHNTAIS